MTDVHDKVVWITGASSGVGEALARELARQGSHVILSARRQTELERVANACAGAASTLVVPMDIADADSIKAGCSSVMARYGRVDILINNAGVSQRSKAVDTPTSVVRRLMDVDFFGPVELTLAVLPGMLERKSGHIVVVTSLVGVFGTPWRSGYAAAKHALHGWYESLRAEHVRDGIVVTIACPGFVRTGISQNALTAQGTPLGKNDREPDTGISAEECARGIVKAVRRNAVEVYVAGAREKLACYVKRAAPSAFARIISRVRVT